MVNRSQSQELSMAQRPQKLDAASRAKALAELSAWRDVPGRDAIQRTFTFADFNAAFGFMSRCALKAEKMDHHPEWFNAYDRVVVDLTTHDAGGISQKDIDLAKRLEEIASKLR
jgi:4a-hydroxytetrahydrobiopterin dehydratase